jgi:hypothetical protein
MQTEAGVSRSKNAKTADCAEDRYVVVTFMLVCETERGRLEASGLLKPRPRAPDVQLCHVRNDLCHD